MQASERHVLQQSIHWHAATRRRCLVARQLVVVVGELHHELQCAAVVLQQRRAMGAGRLVHSHEWAELGFEWKLAERGVTVQLVRHHVLERQQWASGVRDGWSDCVLTGYLIACLVTWQCNRDSSVAALFHQVCSLGEQWHDWHAAVNSQRIDKSSVSKENSTIKRR